MLGKKPFPASLDDIRRDLFRMIDVTPNLDWQLLTKRPENIPEMWRTPEYRWCSQCGATSRNEDEDDAFFILDEHGEQWSCASCCTPESRGRKNCWLGTIRK
jgi:hypothetical protein